MTAAEKARTVSTGMAGLAVLIPARCQEPALVPLVDALLDEGIGAILVVDDGSPATDQEFFAALQRKPRVRLLRHAINLGKGRALKTGMNCFVAEYAGFAGLVTADADGQHSAEDIVRVGRALLAEPGRAVLGCRAFVGQVPLRSRFGNWLTGMVFHFVSGCRVTDTQTGLRAFPAALLPELLALHGERYEYEMTVLAYLSRSGRSLTEVPIATIYVDENRSSHFSPVRDSMRIYFVLLRFYASSLVSAALDLAGFSLVYWLTRNVLLSVALGRISSFINFALNRSLVFHDHTSLKEALWRYYLLAVVLGAISYSAIRGLTQWFGWNAVAIKVIVETALSLISFSVQRTLVFSSGEPNSQD